MFRHPIIMLLDNCALEISLFDLEHFFNLIPRQEEEEEQQRFF